MFHYRRDECMFCATMFKDDLLAMMHLSDHIEKLKRSKESAAQVNSVPKTKNVSTIKTSSKAKTTHMSSEHRSSERQRRSNNSSQSISLSDSTPSRSRELRSNDKSVDGQSLHGTKLNASKHLNVKPPVQKINGHIGQKKELNRPKRDAGAKQETSQERTNDKAERLQENQDAMKESREPAEEKALEQQERLCCPVNGCFWFTDLSKNRVALLYHALEDHKGEEKPLHLAFRVGNGKCSSCMRVMWSFEHFQHHVERHRLAPRHPCLHQGCAARFKTGIEMRRHTRKHSPLQAVCCLPGCSQLFICLWALNLHEREHYASKSTKADKNTDEPTVDGHNNTLQEEKQQNHKANTAANKSVSVKAARKLRREATHDPSTEKPAESVQEDELKDRKETHVLKNLSNKDTSTQPAGPNLRLRHILRTNTTKNHRELKHNNKVRHKFKKKQVKVDTKGPKRRGRPPKAKVAVRDENTTDVPKSEPVVETTKAEKISEVSNESKEEEKSLHIQDEVKTTEELINKSKINKQDHVKQKISIANSVISTTSTDRVRNKAKKRCATTGSGSQTAPSDSKKLKVTETKANAKIVKKKSPVKEPTSASKSPATSTSSNSVPANRLNPIAAPPTTSGEQTKTVGKLRKPHRKEKTASSDTKKDTICKKVDKKTPKGCKDASKTPALKKSKSAQKQAKAAAADVGEKAKEEEKTQKGTTGENSIESNTANGKLKNVQEEGDAGIVKKTCQDLSCASASKEPVNTEDKGVKAEAVESLVKEEETQKCVKQEILTGYGRGPYVRPPPTAYLDEKYITMPKRRKELLFSQSSRKSPPLLQTCSAALPQRQRCANCFATFNSAEDLQSHLQLNKCSNLFGFDSDDEGNLF
ncbi:zinc finger protein 654-like [Eleginops maclovinus]|uniref:zinc finger protein 654-like n=1 Tax=Eleginops maclovinus TaxID=56733 RepID=UPI00307FD7EB